MRFGAFVFPHLGGTYMLFSQLRAGLAPYGIELQWVSSGELAHRNARDPRWAEDAAHGSIIGRPEDDDRQQAIELVGALSGRGFDGIFVNVHGDRVQTNVVRYLPSDLIRIMIVHSITPGTYAAAAAIRDHVHATVSVSPRIASDLVRGYGFDPANTVTILNATPLASRIPPGRPRLQGGLRLLFLGRIEDQAKGVFWLPELMRNLPHSMTLTVAGDGPDLSHLKERCAPLGDRVRFIGAVGPDEVPGVLARHDVFVAPSRFEGLPISLVEAMACGCLPVVSRLRGVTDILVEDGVSGLLFPVGDIHAAASAILRLRDRTLLTRMALATMASVRTHFQVETMVERYRDLIVRIVSDPPPVRAPLDLSRWRMAQGLRPGLRTYLPKPVKNMLRTLKERVA